MKKSILTLALVAATSSSYANTSNVENGSRQKDIVNWTGFVEADFGHNTKHRHNMEFVRKSDGKSFDIVDSPELEKVHCNSSKKLLVELTAERTPKRLFWGNNLIVKNFKILDELEDLPHKKYVPRASTVGDRR